MSQRILFFAAKSKKSLREIFNDNYELFREWCIDKGDYAEALSTDAQDFLLDNEKLPPGTKMDRDVLNELVIQFVSIYCGEVNTKILEFKDPSVRKDRYRNSIKEIENTCPERTIQLWGYLMNGRSLLDGNEGAYSNGCHRLVGYWDVSDQKYLRSELKKINPQDPLNGIRCALQLLDEMANEQAEIIILTA